MRRKRRSSIKKKITRHVVAALVVTVAFMTAINLVYLSRRIIDQQETKLELATQMSANEVESWVKDMAIVTEDMASSLTAMADLTEATVRAVVDRVALNHPEFFYVYFSDYHGNMTMARGIDFKATGVDPRKRGWYQEAAKYGHTVVLDPYASATRPDVMMVTVATPVYWGSTMVGVVAVDADIESIQEFMNTIDFEEGSYGFLLDSKNNIIVHPNSQYNPTSEAIVSAVEVMPELEEVLDSRDEYITAKDYTGTDMVYSVTKLHDSGWTVAVAYPEKAFLSHIDRGIRISIFVAIICALLAVGDITYTVRKVLKPLDKINPAMDRIMEGDFSTPIDFATADDEIGDLQNKLAMSLAELSDIIHIQQHVLAQMEQGNLAVPDMDEFPGEMNDISMSVNSIKATLNDMISDIQFSAINLQSFAMGIDETDDIEEIKAIFEELSAEANVLMDKTSRFITMPTIYDAGDEKEDNWV